MQIIGKQSQHQTKGLTLEKVKICVAKKTRKIKVFFITVNLVRAMKIPSQVEPSWGT